MGAMMLPVLKPNNKDTSRHEQTGTVEMVYCMLTTLLREDCEGVDASSPRRIGTPVIRVSNTEDVYWDWLNDHECDPCHPTLIRSSQSRCDLELLLNKSTQAVWACYQSYLERASAVTYPEGWRSGVQYLQP